ncbi:SRPBCC domain-containing protein [Lysinibacillus yapensis]|uniref:SRPBCC domain-containing protein n=1 Tax=Ureibacillus yapensis TaxID=2304605 RepID=A0A396SAL0_9BACL|nr:SRPBCC domain-containing protein [Lysinibacillus yapensis]RHW38378.1 SRPBCC domain-containing protein [Lysinibacillus yapensis]
MKISAENMKIVRQFNAGPEKVFEAWINPQLMKKWLFTTEHTNIIAKSDAQVNGTWHIVDRRDGEDYVVTGDYVEINRPNKLIITFELPQYTDVTHSLNIDFIPIENGCEMTFKQTLIIPHEKRKSEKIIAKSEGNYTSLSEQAWDTMFKELKYIVEKNEF